MAVVRTATALLLPLLWGAVSGLHAQFMDVAVTSILNVPPIVCADPIVTPRITIKNNSDVVVTSVAVAYGVTAGMPAFDLWEGSLQPGQTVNHDLPPIALPAGEDLFVAAANAPNGLPDQVPENDSWSVLVQVSVPAEVITFQLRTDDLGSDVTWTLANESGTVLYADGPYLDVPGGELFQLPFCLTNGCYTFTINDLFGDGICCGNGEGGYSLVGSDGTVYVQSDGQYGEQDVHEICLNGVQVDEPAPRSLTVVAHPNPTAGMLWLSTPGHPGPLDLRLTDAMGRLMMARRVVSDAHARAVDLSGLPPGLYLLHAQSMGMQGTVRVVVER